VAQPHDIAEEILGKSRNEKQNKSNQCALVLQDEIVLLDDFRFDDLFHKGQTKKTCKDESKPGSEYETDCRIQGAQDGTINVPANEACHFSGDGGKDDLKDLQGYEDNLIERMRGLNKIDELVFVREDDVEIEVEDQIRSDGDEKEKDGELYDRAIIHEG
jgi:hypothetical protein